MDLSNLIDDDPVKARLKKHNQSISTVMFMPETRDIVFEDSGKSRIRDQYVRMEKDLKKEACTPKIED